MDQPSLQAEAEKLLAQMRQVPRRAPGECLRPTEEARILELSADGWTQERIAAEIACHQSTVSRTIAEYDDSRPLARRLLNARALDMAKRFVTDATPRDVLRMMGKLDVVRDDDRHVSVGVQVVVGMPGSPAFRAEDIVLDVPRSPKPASALSSTHVVTQPTGQP